MSFPVNVVFNFLPVLLRDPCVPPFLPSWLAACYAKNSGQVKGFKKSGLMMVLGFTNVLITINNGMDAFFHGVFNFLASCACLIEYQIAIQRQIYLFFSEFKCVALLNL